MNKSLLVVYSNIMFDVAKAKNHQAYKHRGSQGNEGDVRGVPVGQGGRQECHRGSSQASRGPRGSRGRSGMSQGVKGGVKGEFRGVSGGTSRGNPSLRCP